MKAGKHAFHAASLCKINELARQEATRKAGFGKYLHPEYTERKGDVMHERHGKTGTKLYNTWRSMKERCLNPNHRFYHRYGGRGIMVVRAWESFVEFEKWAMKSGYKDGMTIERWDVDFHYQPSNCRWATPLEQGQNRTNSCHVTINGETKSVAAWSRQTGIQISTLYRRYSRGIRGEDFIKPPRK